MWADGQEDNGFVWPVFAQAVLTLRYPAALLADYEDDPKVAVHPRTAAAAQIQLINLYGIISFPPCPRKPWQSSLFALSRMPCSLF